MEVTRNNWCIKQFTFKEEVRVVIITLILCCTYGFSAVEMSFTMNLSWQQLNMEEVQCFTLMHSLQIQISFIMLL